MKGLEIDCYDLDGTLCETRNGDYMKSKPIKARIRQLNARSDRGVIIKIHTARGSETGMDWREFTEQQLAEWGVRYDELFMNKPFAHVYVDDRAVRDTDFFTEK